MEQKGFYWEYIIEKDRREAEYLRQMEEEEERKRKQYEAQMQQILRHRQQIAMQEYSREHFLSSSGYILRDSAGCITSRMLYEQYCRWCEDHNVVPHPPGALYRYLKKHQGEYCVVPTQNIPTTQGTHVRGFRGIRLWQEGDTHHTDK